MRHALYALHLFILFLCSSKTYAQFHFVQATVHFENNSVVQGWIDDLTLGNFPAHIRFKEHADDIDHRFLTASDISGFELSTGEKFISYRGFIDSTTRLEVKANKKPAPSKITDTFYLKQLAAGRINLFYGVDRRGISHLFFSKGNEAIEELHFYTYIYKEEGANRGIYVSGGTRAVYDKRYKQQLLASFQDCQEVFKDFTDSNVNFTKNAIKKWVVKYNACSKPPEKSNEKSIGVSK